MKSLASTGDELFTVRIYMSKKMISGQLRVHLLCNKTIDKRIRMTASAQERADAGPSGPAPAMKTAFLMGRQWQRKMMLVQVVQLLPWRRHSSWADSGKGRWCWSKWSSSCHEDGIPHGQTVAKKEQERKEAVCVSYYMFIFQPIIILSYIFKGVWKKTT